MNNIAFLKLMRYEFKQMQKTSQSLSPDPIKGYFRQPRIAIWSLLYDI
ncbi:hypothetical protein H1P_2290007 [Hyella patelloides LEGE 07179]|uniref:Uncharacterized protein n=1 Tax=Hyella patelloides LEGE 07179 TaxID=945734 RepID=A0A563VRM4_9CYAN|nr:hypothetical protein H1P_2290007 [Hyella patelloides LEGE 07179]